MTTSTSTAAHAQFAPASRSLTDALPALVEQLAGDGFEVFRVMFNPTDWDDAPRRIVVDSRLVKLGWFRTQDAGTLVAIDGSGRNRLVVELTPAK